MQYDIRASVIHTQNIDLVHGLIQQEVAAGLSGRGGQDGFIPVQIYRVERRVGASRVQDRPFDIGCNPDNRVGTEFNRTRNGETSEVDIARVRQ